MVPEFIETYTKPQKAVQTSAKLKRKNNKNKPKFDKKNELIKYGNHNRYVYRNPDDKDVRLNVLAYHLNLFYGQAVLDIGCNIGHVTFSLARDFGVKSVVGMDIDPDSISIARQNLQHYYSNPVPGMPISVRFPYNVSFIKGNYVLKCDSLLARETRKYDVILCFSVTKWIHLNWGDDGLKLAFQRMYAQLQPGGVLVVEHQPWKSYGRRKTLTKTIWKNYKNIKLKPQMFADYLLNEVGFAHCETLTMVYDPTGGFHHPLNVYRKPYIIFI
ncbi:7SK snRNA methylphosphate capping enzyme-like [Melanaphis sacchari]|uniref:7SK snRNA methylphosphate capping enzyme-like n=1 Tax=Melanaphis sacchari TaxID=742174 RepID=UPI000DC157EF|nr:7SK snRNA methylphosphate capping enzyme-like [Melanaphis sacchari]